MTDREQAGFVEEVERPIDFKYYLFLIKKFFYVILTFFIIVVTLASIYVAKIPDQYETMTQLIIEFPILGHIDEDTRATPLHAENRSDEYYNTQIEIIRSLAVLRQVVQELKLEQYFGTDNEDQIVGQLTGMLGVYRLKESRLFNIVATGDDPQFITNLANAVARAYIRKSFEDSLYYSKEFLNWLPAAGAGETIAIKDPFGNVKQATRQELIESLPTIQTDPTIRSLKEKKNFLEAELQSLTRQYREKHPILIKARSSLNFIEESIQSEKNRIIEGLKTQAEGRGQVSTGRIVEEAQVPKGPVGPKRIGMVINVALIELVVSLLVIFLLDFFDDTIHSPEDMERKGLLLPFLGPIPFVKGKYFQESQKTLVVYHGKKSDIAESFRYLRVAINFSATPESLRNLVITSCLPNEGKSFVAHNIAVSLALDGNKTLLVDSDLRRPTVHKNFRVDNATGLSNYLTSNLEFGAVLKESFVENLMIVASGPVSPNPGEILGSARMKLFLEEARKRFDRVIMDCPPFTGLGDSYVIGSLVGHVVMIIASGKTPADLIQRTQKQLEKTGIKIIGAVLNQVDMEKERYHGYSKYYYHTYTRYYDRQDKE